jgi:hypothetical protein
MGRARLAFKSPESLTLPALVPPLWLMWLVLGGLLSLVVPHLGWAWLASIALYVAILCGAAVMLGRGQPASVGLRIPPIFAGIHLGFAWGFLREVARQFKRLR